MSLPSSLILIAESLMCSCSDYHTPNEDSHTKKITFSATVNEKPTTRATTDCASNSTAEDVSITLFDTCDSLWLSTEIFSSETYRTPIARGTEMHDMSNYGSFGVFAYLYEGTWEDAKKEPGIPYMDNVKVTENTEGQWVPSETYYWQPRGKKIRFFAYAPYNSASYEPGTEGLSYHVPSTVEDQPDLIVANSGEFDGGEEHAPVNLVFKHVLTAIRFSVGDDMIPGRISRISLNGVYANGTYDFDTAEWDVTGMPNFTFSLMPDKSIDGTPDTEITSGESTFMMIPQTLPDGAKVEIEFTDDLSGVQHTMSAAIGGTEWKPGKIIQYRISTSSIEIVPTFNVELTNNHFTYKGGTSSFKVTSYADFRNKGTSFHTKPMPWTAKFYGYNSSTKEYDIPLASRPAWITGMIEKADGSVNASNYDFNVSPQSSYTVDETTINLRNASQKGTSSVPYNLATCGGTKTVSTANCYVVDAPGYYSLPLIYGNAIKNSQNNTGAYMKNNAAQFVRHDGNEITSPYLNTNVSGTLTAELGWTDISGRVISVTKNTQSYNLTIGGSSVSVPHLRFQITKTNLTGGNAVILLKNSSGTVVWSWHIWITDRFDESLIVGGKKMLPVLLGWSHDAMKRYDERSVKVIFTQQSTNTVSECLIAQEKFDAYVSGTCTYYQWGRKDPIIGRNGNSNVTWFDVNNSTSTSLLTMTSTATNVWARIYQMISKPWAFYSEPSTYPLIHHFWNMNNTVAYQNPASGIKTIYDPCPPGFRIPTGVELNTSIINNTDRLFDEVSTAWRFNTNLEGKTTFFPLIGARALDGSLKTNGEQGRTWTSQTYPAGARMFFLTKDELGLQTSSGTSTDGASPNNGASIIAIGE